MAKNSGAGYYIAGNVNMKGKKSMLLDCLCCDLVNLKDRLESRRIARELREIDAKRDL